MADEKEKSAVEERMRAAVTQAQRDRDQVAVDTLRMAVNAFHLEEVARTDAKHPQKGKALTEADRYGILEKQVKQRDEAAAIYRKGNRPELAEKEEREAAILKAYLPAQLSDDELRAIVRGIIEREGKDFKKVMPVASRETKGRADGKRVLEIVREATN
jgi:uncharacterized protein YqeY